MALAYGITAAVSLCMLGLCVALDKKRDEYLLLVFVSVFVCNLGYFMVSVSSDLGSALTSNRIAYLGSVFLPFFMLMMVLRFCSIRSSKRMLIIFVVIGVAVLGIACTPGIVPLYYSSVSISFEAGGTKLVREYGPLHFVYYVYLFAYMGGMLGVSLYSIIKKRIIYPAHTVGLLCVTLCNIVIWLVEQFLPRGFEWLSVSYILTECFVLALYRSMQKRGVMRVSSAVPFRIRVIQVLFLLLLASFIRVVAIDAAPVPYILSHVVVLLIYLAILFGWSISVYERVVHRPIRRQLMLLVGLMILWFLARTLRFTVFYHVYPAGMWMWYAYYISMLLIPTACFLAARYIAQAEDFRFAKGWYLMYIPALVLTAGILTNDLHQWAFYFHEGYEAGWDVYQRRFLYYLAAAWIFGCIALMIGQFFRRCRVPGTKKLVWMPVMVLGIGVAYSVLYLLDSALFGFVEVTAALCFTVVGIWESCIQTGLIQSNTHYGSMFSAMRYPAVIVDEDGRAHYTGGAMHPLEPSQIRAAQSGPVLLDADTRLQSYHVSGGRILWLEDIKEINERLKELGEIREQLSEENDLLTAENKLKEQRTAIETRNRLYAGIVPVITPQLNIANGLLKGTTAQDPDLNRKLALISVCATYIKRRTNLELVSREDGYIASGELVGCIRESIAALRAVGVEAVLNTSGEGRIPMENAVFTYEWIEHAVEAALPALQAIVITLMIHADGIKVRVIPEGCSQLPDMGFGRAFLAGCGGETDCLTDEEGEIILSLRLPERGGGET